MPIYKLSTWFAPTQKNKTPEELATSFLELVSKPPNNQGKTRLHLTADEAPHQDKFRIALITLFFEQKDDANALDNHGKTALHDLAEKYEMPPLLNSFETIAELFFKNGAQFNIQDTHGNIPLDLALQRSNPDSIVVKALIKFLLLELPHLAQPNSIKNARHLSGYWSICKNNIHAMQNQKIPDASYTLYDICAARNLTQFAKQNFSHHLQIRNFDPETIKKESNEYSDRLLVNVKSLQQEIARIVNTNTIITKTNLIFRKNQLPIIEEIIREIFNYLSPTEIQNMHKAVHPDFFKNKNAGVSEKIDVEDKITVSCCIS